MRSVRQGGGLSGFTKRAESEYDPFGAAHSSTSISAGLGFAVARDLAQQSHNVVCVIGDGAMSAGMAYEAMNNAGALGARLRELRWKNSAWLATADTIAGWNGFEIRNAGSGRSPVRKRSG